ncbi:MAG TPA: hypothetical protein VK797_30180 [Tepidisphaeraceae bacterium]|jgi:hypothetical protein|nr:hypothetical protein [Tepidisphaeraceae bacterium]
MVAIAARRERCARCGQVISRRQVPSVWHNHIVCGRCHSKLRALEPAMALSKAVQPDLQFARHPDANAQSHHPGQVLGRCVAAMKRTFHFAK